MGDVVSNNCKSGKDRTGQSEVYQHAMTLISNNNRGKVHRYGTGEKENLRHNFRYQAATLNSSLKIQESAALNTPGSRGTKAGKWSNIIDKKITTTGEFKDIYPISCACAEMNKPSKFTSDEEKKMHDLSNENKNSDSKKEQSANSPSSPSSSSSSSAQIDFMHQSVIKSTENMPKYSGNYDLKSFASTCSRFNLDSKCIHKSSYRKQKQWIEKIDKINESQDENAINHAVSLILKAVLTPSDQNKGFATNDAANDFCEAFNKGEIKRDIKRIICDKLEIKEGAKLNTSLLIDKKEKILADAKEAKAHVADLSELIKEANNYTSYTEPNLDILRVVCHLLSKRP